MGKTAGRPDCRSTRGVGVSLKQPEGNPIYRGSQYNFCTYCDIMLPDVDCPSSTIQKLFLIDTEHLDTQIWLR